MLDEKIEDLIARRVVELLQEHKFKIEQRRWAEIMDLETAAEYMSRTVSGVRNMVRTGQIPAVRGDRKIQIRKSDIDAWAARSVERQ